jgi:hypothetical protein
MTDSAVPWVMLPTNTVFILSVTSVGVVGVSGPGWAMLLALGGGLSIIGGPGCPNGAGGGRINGGG